jgi:hypothetical protein
MSVRTKRQELGQGRGRRSEILTERDREFLFSKGGKKR